MLKAGQAGKHAAWQADEMIGMQVSANAQLDRQPITNTQIKKRCQAGKHVAAWQAHEMIGAQASTNTQLERQPITNKQRQKARQAGKHAAAWQADELIGAQVSANTQLDIKTSCPLTLN